MSVALATQPPLFPASALRDWPFGPLEPFSDAKSPARGGVLPREQARLGMLGRRGWEVQ